MMEYMFEEPSNSDCWVFNNEHEAHVFKKKLTQLKIKQKNKKLKIKQKKINYTRSVESTVC